MKRLPRYKNHGKKRDVMIELNKAVVATLVVVLLSCVGCASDTNGGGEVVSSVLMGIGTGLSSL